MVPDVKTSEVGARERRRARHGGGAAIPMADGRLVRGIATSAGPT